MKRFLVQAAWRGPGVDAWRAGRRWSSEDPVVVDLVDAEDDPPQEPGQGIRIGRKSLEALQGDPVIDVLDWADGMVVPT